MAQGVHKRVCFMPSVCLLKKHLIYMKPNFLISVTIPRRLGLCVALNSPSGLLPEVEELFNVALNPMAIRFFLTLFHFRVLMSSLVFNLRTSYLLVEATLRLTVSYQ